MTASKPELDGLAHRLQWGGAENDRRLYNKFNSSLNEKQMNRTKLKRSVWQSVLARVNGRIIRPLPTPRFGQRVFSSAPALLLLLALAVLAFPNRAFAGPFAATTLNPSTQTVNVGTPVTVDVVYAIGTAQYGTTYGVDLRIDFDATKLRVDSVTTGSSSPFTTLVAGKNVFDNTTGLLRYGATGPAADNVTYTVARITFMPIAAGTSVLHLHEVSQYFTGYGPFGVDGLAVGGSITSKLTPVITWANPAGIAYGTELSAAQLNATANVAGTFTYSPAAGIVLDPGTRTLTANFTPSDTAQYNSASKQVTLTVADTTPGVVVAWGNNASGQTDVPAGLDGVTAVAAGLTHSVALKADGTVVAWGSNNYGQTTVPASLSNVTAIAAGTYHTVALKTTGTVVAWGDQTIVPGLTSVAASLTGVKAIATGADHVVALKSNGTVVAWGSNGNGQTNVPAGLSGVKAIAAGLGHTIALKTNGTVVRWGFNLNGTTMNTPTGLTTNLTAIAAGQYHYAALKTNGTVVAWGDNTFGQTNVPPGLNNVIAIAAGDNYTLALKADNTVVAWGDNSIGQTNVPPGLNNVTAIAAGRYHATAVVNARPPLLSAITPTEALGGASNPVTLSLQGSGFTSTSAVRWDSWDQTTNLVVTFVNSSSLTAEVPASFLPEPWGGIQTAQIAVVNPLGGVSAAKPFTTKAANVGSLQSKVAAPGQTSTVQTVPTAANQAGLSASFVNSSGNPATVTSAVYTSDPPFGTTIDTGGGVVDFQISGADASDSATVQFYYSSAVTAVSNPTEASLVLRYYKIVTSPVYFAGWTNLLSSGSAAPVKNTTNNLDGTVSGGRFTVVFNNTSTPKITELGGTVIAMSVNHVPVVRSKDVAAFADANCSTDASIDDGSFDSDTGDTITLTQTPAGPYPVGVTTVTLTVTDSYGASASSTATVTVVDNTPPTLTVPAPIVVGNDPGHCDAVVVFAVNATDDCSGVTVVSTPASGSTFPKGTTTVTSVATDGSGNTTGKTFTVTVNDAEAPSLTIPAPIVVSNTPGSCDAVVSFTVTAADNCSGVNVVSTPASGSTFAKGTTTVTSVATDASGNATTKTFTVTVNDTEAPSLTVPAPIAVSNTPGSCDAVVSFTVTAADNCSGVTVVSTPVSGSTFPKGTSTVTSVATDVSGNATTKTFTVTVNDTEAPSLTVPAPIVVSNTPGSCDAVVNFTVTAADNCSGVTVVSTPDSGSTFPKGATTVTSVATDASGNTTTKTFTVTVNDTEAPSLTVPSPIVLRAAAGRCDAVVSYAVTAADNCPGVTVVNTPASGSTFALGTTTVTSVATDTSGNVTTKTFTVTVKENVEIGNAVVVARNSVSIEQNAVIRSGDVIVNEIATGTVAKDGPELSIGQNATTPAGFALRANRISIGQKAVINGDLYYNTLVNKEKNTLQGTQHTPWPLPIFCSLPPFESGPAGAQDINAKQGETVTLNEGNYRDVVLKEKSTLLFTGGTYNLRNLSIGQKVTVQFAGPSAVRIAGKFALDQKSTVGPKTGSSVGAADIVFYVNGSNAGAATIAQNCTVQANIYAPNGTISIEQNAKATGAFLARDVVVSQNAELSLASHFGNASSSSAGLLSLGLRAGGTSFVLPVITRTLHTTEGGMELRFTGRPGSAYSVQFSPDLKSWEAMSEVQAGPDGAIQFTDSAAGEVSMRFYRVIPVQSGSASGVGEAVNR